MEIDFATIEIDVEPAEKRQRILKYLEILMETNRQFNLISRKMNADGLSQLLKETLILEKMVGGQHVVDAGSGNGLLGIPFAIMNPDKSVDLVEPKVKKCGFLETVKNQLELSNLIVYNLSIEEFLKKKKKRSFSLIARGFPKLEVFCGYLKKKMIHEAVLITSENKIKKNQIHMESIEKKIYNVPLREELKILKIWRTIARD
jgi:16S rRNA (guanine(527)-N(7))-methyltransferase RsmG